MENTNKKINNAKKGKEITINGVTYPSISACAKAHNISVNTLYKRLNKGLTPEKAVLDLDYKKKEIAVDGKVFSSMADCARTHNVSENTFRERILSGKTPEEALSQQGRIGKKVIVEGKEYASISACARAYNIPFATLKRRLNEGWDPDKAVVKKKKNNIIDSEFVFNGVNYSSLSDFCKKNNYNLNTIRSRIKKGLTIDEAIQLNQYKNTGKIIKYKGKIYPSYVEIARVFDVDYDTFRRRMERGWSIDEALDPQLKKTSLILKKEQK